MDIYIIIPSHNEEAYLASTLDSILRQSLKPKKVVVVNDHSTDGTEVIIDSYVVKSPLFQKLNTTSSGEHMPGSKVVAAFQKGLDTLDEAFDILLKLDADIILPNDYLEKIALTFRNNPTVGIAGGFAYEKDSQGNWLLNHPMNKDHVRGAFKAYSKRCFQAIGGLKCAMGWDTVDELLARYHGYGIYTDENLKLKHLRPLGNAYDSKAKLLQGTAMYRMRYGYIITVIASIKMAWKLKKGNAFSDNMKGYRNARRENRPFLVSKEEGVFIRGFRWKNILRKLF